MMMPLSEDDLEPRGPVGPEELVGEVRWRHSTQQFKSDNGEVVPDSLESLAIRCTDVLVLF